MIGMHKQRIWRFWILTLAALCAAGGTFLLGQWQLRRADQKTALYTSIQAQKQRPALENSALEAIKNIAPEIHRPVLLTGQWIANKTIYLDNRAMNGRAGFWVVTPLLLATGSAAQVPNVILVQRGWIARDFTDRTRLPDFATPGGTLTVVGRLALPPSQLLTLGVAEQGSIRQNVDLAQLRGETGLPMRVDAMVLQTESSLTKEDGLSRAWVAPESGVAKHHGYAFQWFCLSALVLGLYAWFQIIVPLKNRRKKPLSIDHKQFPSD